MLELPDAVRGILGEIRGAGGSGWVVGGALRDLLLGDTPGDWDLAVSLNPEQILNLFPGGRLIGGVCGTVNVRYAGVDFEITPFRAEEGYTDQRHPDKVEFVPGILQDLARRDFTINAMAYDGSVLLDPFGGQQDLENRLIRCVGTPLVRFSEDPLRILRMLRFGSVLGFSFEKRTRSAARAKMETIAILPRERVRGEMHRILLGANPGVLGMLVQGGGLRRYGFYFAPSLSALAAVPAGKLCRWWALATLCGVDMRRMGQSFGFSRRFVSQLVECVRLYEAGPSDGALALKMKLYGSSLDYGPVSSAFAAVSPVFAGEPRVFLGVQLRGEPYRLEDLAVNGDDLLAEGISGHAVGDVLKELLYAVIRAPKLNEKTRLLAIARAIAQNSPGA